MGGVNRFPGLYRGGRCPPEPPRSFFLIGSRDYIGGAQAPPHKVPLGASARVPAEARRTAQDFPSDVAFSSAPAKAPARRGLLYRC